MIASAVAMGPQAAPNPGLLRSPPIAVTGMAWTTALGDDLSAVWSRLLAAETGLLPVPHIVRLRSSLAGVAAGSPPLDAPAGDRMTALALPALQRALAAAGRDATDPDVRF